MMIIMIIVVGIVCVFGIPLRHVRGLVDAPYRGAVREDQSV